MLPSRGDVLRLHALVTAMAVRNALEDFKAGEPLRLSARQRQQPQPKGECLP